MCRCVAVVLPHFWPPLTLAPTWSLKGARSISISVFPTRLLTSEDEYRWHWHQMIYFPETINTINTLNTITTHLHFVSSKLCTLLTLCMLASRSRGEFVFLSLLSSSHSVTTCHVLSLPLSGLNWPSLSPAMGSWPPSSKMASLFRGSAHPPFSGSSTIRIGIKMEVVSVNRLKPHSGSVGVQPALPAKSGRLNKLVS